MMKSGPVSLVWIDSHCEHEEVDQIGIGVTHLSRMQSRQQRGLDVLNVRLESKLWPICNIKMQVRNEDTYGEFFLHERL